MKTALNVSSKMNEKLKELMEQWEYGLICNWEFIAQVALASNSAAIELGSAQCAPHKELRCGEIGCPIATK